MGDPKRSSSSTLQKRTGSCFTKPLWLPANLPFQLLDLTIFLFLRLHRCPLIQPPPFLFCFGLCKRLVFIARLSAVMALCSLLAPSVSFSYCSAICVSAFLSCWPNPPLIQLFNYITVIYWHFEVAHQTQVFEMCFSFPCTYCTWCIQVGCVSTTF